MIKSLNVSMFKTDIISLRVDRPRGLILRRSPTTRFKHGGLRFRFTRTCKTNNALK